MKTSSVLVFGDLHYSADPPASRRDSYRKELDEMLAEIARLAKKLDVDAVCSVGDHFHRKGRTSHGEVMSLLSAYRRIKEAAPFYAIPGNHDMVGHNLATVEESQPLGVLSRAEVVRLVHEEPIGVVNDSGLMVYGVPYFPDPSPAKIRAHVETQVNNGGRPSAAVVLLHHDIIGKDQARPYAAAIRAATKVPTAILNGHIHEGVWSDPIGTDSVFVATGSLARTSVAERLNQPSVVAVTFPEVGRPKVVEIPLASALPITEAFDPDAVASAGVKNEDLDTFVELVGGEGEESAMDVRVEARELGGELQVPKPGVEEALRILEESYHRP